MSTVEMSHDGLRCSSCGFLPKTEVDAICRECRLSSECEKCPNCCASFTPIDGLVKGDSDPPLIDEILERLGKNTCCDPDCDCGGNRDAIQLIEKLRKERDEAKRELKELQKMFREHTQAHMKKGFDEHLRAEKAEAEVERLRAELDGEADLWEDLANAAPWTEESKKRWMAHAEKLRRAALAEEEEEEE